MLATAAISTACSPALTLMCAFTRCGSEGSMAYTVATTVFGGRTLPLEPRRSSNIRPPGGGAWKVAPAGARKFASPGHVNCVCVLARVRGALKIKG